MSEATVARHGPDALSVLRDPATIRTRCAAITRAVSEGRSAHFAIRRERLDEVARRIETVTRANYPALDIPVHSRWRHFEAGGVDRKAELDALLAGRSPAEQARARIDLSVISVLLDAGAGAEWRYAEAESGQSFGRSEGLAVASFRAFVAGAFSGTPGEPLRVDAGVLRRLDTTALRSLLQARPGNTPVGLEGRAALLNRLGDALQAQAARQGLAPRPGSLYDRLTEGGQRLQVSAAQVLAALLEGFSSIWVSGSVLHGVPLGDVWPHPWAGGESPIAGRHGTTDGWVPFHKLSQWLAYSLLEPLQWSGVEVGGLDALTGLAEYRNGGLLLDGGVIQARDPRLLARRWKPGDEFVIEWRALTISLLDELLPLVRARLGLDAQQLPLARMLQGGSWAAGRQIAAELREGGAPPLHIDSDGTVF